MTRSRRPKIPAGDDDSVQVTRVVEPEWPGGRRTSGRTNPIVSFREDNFIEGQLCCPVRRCPGRVTVSDGGLCNIVYCPVPHRGGKVYFCCHCKKTCERHKPQCECLRGCDRQTRVIMQRILQAPSEDDELLESASSPDQSNDGDSGYTDGASAGGDAGEDEVSSSSSSSSSKPPHFWPASTSSASSGRTTSEESEGDDSSPSENGEPESAASAGKPAADALPIKEEVPFNAKDYQEVYRAYLGEHWGDGHSRWIDGDGPGRRKLKATIEELEAREDGGRVEIYRLLCDVRTWEVKAHARPEFVPECLRDGEAVKGGRKGGGARKPSKVVDLTAEPPIIDVDAYIASVLLADPPPLSGDIVQVKVESQPVAVSASGGGASESGASEESSIADSSSQDRPADVTISTAASTAASAFDSDRGKSTDGPGSNADEGDGDDSDYVQGADGGGDNDNSSKSRKHRARKRRKTSYSSSRTISRPPQNDHHVATSSQTGGADRPASSSRKAPRRASSGREFTPNAKGEETWQRCYEELRAYKEARGNCLVPQNYEPNPSLARWVRDQRKEGRKFKKGEHAKINDERIKRLNDLGFTFQPVKWGLHKGNFQRDDDAWDNKFKAICEYRAQHGDCLVPTRYAKNHSLANWVATQRNHYRLRNQGKPSHTTEERIQKLDGIGFSWSPSASGEYKEKKESQWMRRYTELKEFKHKHGNCLVPFTYPENPSLTNWVRTQRNLYRLRKQGKPSAITEERIQKLEEMGFSWNPSTSGERKRGVQKNESQWMRRHKELLEFKQEQGHCNVPTKYAANPSLGKWVTTQRQQYRLRKQGKHSLITEDRIRKLQDIGFVWTGNNDQWMMRYEELREFEQKRGHCNVPTEYAANRALGRWVPYQRTQCRLRQEGKPSQITEDRIRKLQDIDFTWALRGT